jgi:hypothetical protein
VLADVGVGAGRKKLSIVGATGLGAALVVTAIGGAAATSVRPNVDEPAVRVKAAESGENHRGREGGNEGSEEKKKWMETEVP